MDKDFEYELKGSLAEATAAKNQIAKYFKRYGESDNQDAKKYQLIFASKIMCIMSKCENKNMDVYCKIIEEIFANNLCPEASAKYWTLYVNCVRYFHYILVEKKDFDKASMIYRHISSYKSKLQNSENSYTCINIYCYQLFLQNSLKLKNQELALREATLVIENLTKLFNEILNTNKKQNFQYPDILKKSMSWLFPQNKIGTVYQFLKCLPEDKIKQLFQALFAIYGRQKLETNSSENVQEHARFIIETIYTLLQVDIMDKMQLQLSIQLMANCGTDNRIQTNKAIAELFLLLYDYLKLLCDQKPTLNFQHTYNKLCQHFKELFDKYAKSVMNQLWFGDFLVLIFYLHSLLQNISIFSCFWKQMCKPNSYKSMFDFFVELMKLAPCISVETKLFTINCCTSTRKHVILSFAQIALAGFVFYCQNVNEDCDEREDMETHNNNHTDYYKERIQNNIILIINHAFKIIDKMECITSNSQEIDILLTRFKQATLSCKTYKQAGTCVSICELFLKIKTKIPGKEWPLLLRRLYRTTTQLITDAPQIGRDLQMCYIASMLHDSVNEIDINHIRTQISIFYATETTTINANEQQKQQQQHEHCLLQLYHTTTSMLRPHLDHSRKKLLHWLESQHILKYYKLNTTLLHSLLKYSQSVYDFVLITKLGKLNTYAMAKITSIYKSIKSKGKELSVLSRLEYLTFGHVCVMMLNEINMNQKFQIDSKDLSEEQLENLFRRPEMSSITIHNDLKRFKLASEALKAFGDFYEKFDNETISMDDAIIDWESLLDDLANLGLSLQLSGFMEYSFQAWLLHYKCSRLIQDDFSALRGLTYFCEYAEYCDINTNNGQIKLEQEIQYNFPTIIYGLENLENLPRQTYQSNILLAVVQIAHYYARSLRFSFAQILLQYVQQKHAELPKRQGRYDIVLATIDAIKFRLLWKHFNDSNETMEVKAPRTTAENLLLHRCLLHEIEETLDRFHDFSYISSCDGVLYSILIINLVQELAECTVNRLCDNFINALFIATCKCTLLLGLALRFVQVMSMWMWVNLQMEYVDKAQVKLKIIEFVMGIKTFKELAEKCTKSLHDVHIQPNIILPTSCSELLTPNYNNPGMEAIRKVPQLQLSPIKTNKLQLSPSYRNFNLERYFNPKIDSKLVPHNEQIEWLFFLVGCLNARLYFLVDDYDQLEAFYEKGTKWLQQRQNSFSEKYYKNIKIMVMQHYANFLRSQQMYNKALKCLEYGIELCENKKFHIDAVYFVNFQLQLIATQKEINSNKIVKKNLPTHSKLRKALQFNISPESTHTLQEPSKRELKEALQIVTASAKKSSSVMKPLRIHTTETGCSSTKKIRTQTGVTINDSSSSSGSSSSIDIKTIKPKPKFNICEDSFEIVEIFNNIDELSVVKDSKSIKRTKIVEENQHIYKTPKVVRKITKSSSKTTGKKVAATNKRPDLIPQFCIDIDLTDSPSPSSVKSLISSSLENLKVKENLNANEIVEKMQNLEIGNCKATKISATEIETKTLKGRCKSNHAKEYEAANNLLVNSPCTLTQINRKFVDKPKLSRTRAGSKDKNFNDTSTSDDNLISTSRSRSQRKLMLDNNDKQNPKKVPPSTCSTTAGPSVTKRRQKNLV